MTENKVYAFILMALLLILRSIINNKIYNEIEGTNTPVFDFDSNHEYMIRRFKTALVFWLKIDKEYRTLAIISNIMFLFLIILFVLTTFVWD